MGERSISIFNKSYDPWDIAWVSLPSDIRTNRAYVERMLELKGEPENWVLPNLMMAYFQMMLVAHPFNEGAKEMICSEPMPALFNAAFARAKATPLRKTFGQRNDPEHIKQLRKMVLDTLPSNFVTSTFERLKTKAVEECTRVSEELWQMKHAKLVSSPDPKPKPMLRLVHSAS